MSDDDCNNNMSTIEDFFGAVGVIALSVPVGCALWALVSWVAGFCKILYYDGRMAYLHSRMHRWLAAQSGDYVYKIGCVRGPLKAASYTNKSTPTP